jgi:hypothetical protein
MASPDLFLYQSPGWPPDFDTLNILWVQRKEAQIRVSACSQGFTLTQNAC